MNEHKNNPMHGVKLQQILEELEARYGWEVLAELIHINCFAFDPSIKSCLKFLRKTPWARTKVEALYLQMLAKKSENEKSESEKVEDEKPEVSNIEVQKEED